jgi:hypothetical protein
MLTMIGLQRQTADIIKFLCNQITHDATPP